MGVHHAWGRSLKDMYQRYHAMNGQALRYQNGFDCQGLWVEVEVEKSLGLGTKREIRDFGIENFVRACKERVLTYAARQTEQSIRLGYWCDWDDPKAPPRAARCARRWRPRGHRHAAERPHGSDRARQRNRPQARLARIRRQLLHLLRREQLHHLGLPQEVPRRGLHLSRPRRDALVRPLRHRPFANGSGRGPPHHHPHFRLRAISHSRPGKTALLVWTTTPWTLTSNVAVAVNPEMTYLKVRHGDWMYYVAKANFEHDRLQDLQVEGKHETHKLPSIRTILKGSGGVEVFEELPGRDCSASPTTARSTICRRRTRPAASSPTAKPAAAHRGGRASRHRLERNQRSRRHRSGPHRARLRRGRSGAWAKENSFPFIAPLDESAVFIDGFGPFTGQNASDVADEVVQR
jgi:isoleucyl-tRNA synthetase